MSQEKLWIDNLSSLFKKWTIIPSANMTKEEKLNSITRLIVVVSIILLLVDKRDASLYVLILGLLVVIVLYSQEPPPIVEGFDPILGNSNEGAPSSGGKAPIFTCDVTYYPTFVSQNSENVIGKNNALTGPQNPKTLISPPIAPPLADLDTWKASEFTTHTHINSRTVQYEDEYNGNYSNGEVNWLSGYQDQNANKPCFKRYFTSSGEFDTIEPFDTLIKDLDNGIKEDFISELQPGILTSNIDQPIMANLGLLPDIPKSQTTLYTPIINGKPRDGLQIYVEDKAAPLIRGVKTGGYNTLDRAYENPRKYVKERLPQRFGAWSAKQSIIPGDNRFNSIGSCPGGQVGIEQVRDLSGAEEMSEYYNKNKLDMYDVDRHAPLYEINADAVQTQIAVTNRFRSDMQETLMRKRNAEQWARKQYPIDTNHRRMLGGHQ